MPAADQLPAVAAYDVEQHLLVRTAWLYFAGGITQDGIARQLGLTRARVNRLIADARAKGIVQISINSPLASAVALESELAERFGLQQVVIVPSPGDDEALPALIGAAAGAVFGGHIRDGMSVGVGWGRTLRISLQSIPRRTRVDLTVVSLIGGLTRSSAINTYETASHLAELFGAECTYIAGPAYCDSEASRDVLQSQSIVREALERARRADLALVSVGSVEPDATMVKLGLITRADQASLVRAGAVGDLGSHWIDEYGRLVDHPLNRRAVALVARRTGTDPESDPRLRRPPQGEGDARRAGARCDRRAGDRRGDRGRRTRDVQTVGGAAMMRSASRSDRLPVLAAVDWGTSSFRLWLLDAAGAVVAERRGSEGMATLQPDQFEAVLRGHLAAAGVDGKPPGRTAAGHRLRHGRRAARLAGGWLRRCAGAASTRSPTPPSGCPPLGSTCASCRALRSAIRLLPT